MLANYRLIRQQQPRAWDSRSNRDRGWPPAPRETAFLHCGVSMFSDPEAALSRARRTPVYLAAVTLATGRGLHLAKTGSRSHYTVWGTPEDLAACARPYHSPATMSYELIWDRAWRSRRPLHQPR